MKAEETKNKVNKAIEKTYRAIDRIMFVHIYNEERKTFESGLDNIDKVRTDVDAVFKLMDAIDNKSAALLTHISLIFAALSVTYNSIDPGSYFSRFILAEIIIYLLITLPCLRCIRIMPFEIEGQSSKIECEPSDADKKKKDKSIDMDNQKKELFNRILIYRICNISALIATFSLVLLFVGKMII